MAAAVAQYYFWFRVAKRPGGETSSERAKSPVGETIMPRSYLPTPATLERATLNTG